MPHKTGEDSTKQTEEQLAVTAKIGYDGPNNVDVARAVSGAQIDLSALVIISYISSTVPPIAIILLYKPAVMAHDRRRTQSEPPEATERAGSPEFSPRQYEAIQH